MLYSIFTTFWLKNLELIQFDKKLGSNHQLEGGSAGRWYLWLTWPADAVVSETTSWDNEQNSLARGVTLENDPFLYHILQLLVQMQSLIWDFWLQEPGIPCVSNWFFTCFCYESSASMTRTTGRYLNANESVDGICELCGAVTKAHSQSWLEKNMDGLHPRKLWHTWNQWGCKMSFSKGATWPGAS